MRSFDWNSLRRDCVSEYTANFIETLNNLYKKCCPLVTKFVSARRLDNPWVTEEIRKLLRAKSSYFELFKLGFVTETENRAMKNKVKSIVSRYKSNYYKNIFACNKYNLRKTWSTIRSLVSRNVGRTAIKLIIVNGTEVTDSQVIADLFGEYFGSASRNLERNLSASPVDPLTYLLA